MILGLGIDLCPVDRIEQILERHAKSFAGRVFTDNERDYAGTGLVKGERLAARFAAKEAAIKALGAPNGLRWQEMEVVKSEDGVPSMRFHGLAEQHASELGVTNILLTLSHAGGFAVAVVILEGGK